jgi:hypothetical protein
MVGLNFLGSGSSCGTAVKWLDSRILSLSCLSSKVGVWVIMAGGVLGSSNSSFILVLASLI